MKPIISVITPCFNERDSVASCRDRVRAVFREHLQDYDYEHIFTDNRSSDGTRQALRELAAEDGHVKVILNSRNFGAEASMLNALNRAGGDAIMVMVPADAQDPPELLPEFVAKWRQGYQVVYGYRLSRDENPLMHGVRRLFYRAVNWLSSIDIPLDTGEFQLIDRAVANALGEFGERQPYLRGMIASCGFKRTGIGYTMERRRHGSSTMNLWRLMDQGLNGLISFSSLPMRICMGVGAIISLISLLYAFFSFVVSIIYFRELAEPGIPTIIVGLFFFGGVQLFFLGVLGEYILAIHSQVRRRPLVIEETLINFEEDL